MGKQFVECNNFGCKIYFFASDHKIPLVHLQAQAWEINLVSKMASIKLKIDGRLGASLLELEFD